MGTLTRGCCRDSGPLLQGGDAPNLRSQRVAPWFDVAPTGPVVATMGPVLRVELERVEALELLGMTLAHLNVAESRSDMTPRVALLMSIREKLALALREET